MLLHACSSLHLSKKHHGFKAPWIKLGPPKGCQFCRFFSGKKIWRHHLADGLRSQPEDAMTNPLTPFHVCYNQDRNLRLCRGSLPGSMHCVLVHSIQHNMFCHTERTMVSSKTRCKKMEGQHFKMRQGKAENRFKNKQTNKQKKP